MKKSGVSPEYATARRVLIDAIRALSHLEPSSIILVGAHAVYLRAPENILPIAPFTLDGDLVADPRKIREPQLILEALENAQFSLRSNISGLYSATYIPEAHRQAARVDVFVPEQFSAHWDLGKLSPLGASATLSQPGLELALVDRSPMLLEPLNHEAGSESVTVEVAGILALIVAKSWKIGERFDQGAEAFLEVTKDIADLYRLLRASNPSAITASIRDLPVDQGFHDVLKTGTQHLQKVFTKGSPATALLRKALGTGNEVEIITASLEALVSEFIESALHNN